jgi:hypothetical protein
MQFDYSLTSMLPFARAAIRGTSNFALSQFFDSLFDELEKANVPGVVRKSPPTYVKYEYNEMACPEKLRKGGIEVFCHISCGDSLVCLPVLWRNGVMTPLPTLGGNNGMANSINSRGQVVGQAENIVHDPTCLPPQVLQFKPAIWEKGEVNELPTLAGYPNGLAQAINDNGQAVGVSVDCSFSAGFGLLWRHGKFTDLGSKNSREDFETRLAKLENTIVPSRISAVTPTAPGVRAVTLHGAPNVPERPQVPVQFEHLVKIGDED